MRRHGGMQHFCTGIKAKDMPAFLAMVAGTNAKRYQLAARNNEQSTRPDKQTRAAVLWERMRDHSNPQMELAL